MNAITKIDVPSTIADVDPRTLTINPENERFYDLDSEDNVALRQSIAANGVLMPLHIYEDGVVDNGNRRLSNILRLISEGVSIATVPTIVVPRPTDEVDAVVRRLNMNEAKQFSALEQGIAFAKLRTAGLNNTDIAKRTPFTSMHIGNILTLHDAPESVRNAVRDRAISATLATETLRARASFGDGEEVIALAIQAATEAGRKASQRFVDMVIAARTPVEAPVEAAVETVQPEAVAVEVEVVAQPATVEVEAVTPATGTTQEVPFDLDDTHPAAPAVATEVEVEATTPATPVEAAITGKPTMKQLLSLIAPVIDSLASVVGSGASRADKAAALDEAKDDLDAFIVHAKSLGLLG